MRIVYFGSSANSATLLDTLIKVHDVCCVISNTDKPVGRNQKEATPTHVSQFVLEYNKNHANPIELLRPKTLRNNEDIKKKIQEMKPELFFVFAYGKIIPLSLLDIPTKESINLHGSLLPHLRGASPVQAALRQGDTETGWTIQCINERLDEGDVIEQVKFPILPNENAIELMNKMMPSGIEMSLHAIHKISTNDYKKIKQEERHASYCNKIKKEDSQINWSNEAKSIHNQIRAYYEWPVAFSYLNHNRLRIFSSAVLEEKELLHKLASATLDSGSVCVYKRGKKYRLFIACNTQINKQPSSYLEILEVQYDNGKRSKMQDFCNGKGRSLFEEKEMIFTEPPESLFKSICLISA